MNKKPIVYILILNYCSLEDTIECINSVRKCSYTDIKLLVIDNNSPDGSGRKIKKHLNNTNFIPLKRNTGYAEGNNIGIKLALANGADYIFIVNPDVRLPKESITTYVSIMKENPDIGALNPVQLNSEGNELDEKFSRGIFTYQNRAIPSLQELQKEKTLWESNTLYGAAIMLPSNILRQVGGFDPIYFAYGEEEDLCRRIKLADYKLYITSQEPIKHLRTKEKNKTYRWRILFLRLRGKYLFILKNPHKRFLLCLKEASNEFYSDLFAKGNLDYPYLYSHFFSISVWFILNIFRIYKHRELDNHLGAYIS